MGTRAAKASGKALLRMPKELHARLIAAAARKRGRSVTSLLRLAARKLVDALDASELRGGAP